MRSFKCHGKVATTKSQPGLRAISTKQEVELRGVSLWMIIPTSNMAEQVITV